MRQIIKYVILLPVFFIFTYPNIFFVNRTIETGFYSTKKMEIGEDLLYVVKYSFFKLGEVRLKVIDRKEEKGRTYYKTIAYIDSYPGIPFVSLHQIYESCVNLNYYSDFFRGLVKGDEYTSYTEYYFNYNSNKIKIKKGKVKPPELWTDSTTRADKKYQDGLSIFYYARMNLGSKTTVNIPCFVAEKKVYTKINFYTEVNPQHISAVDYDIACLRLDGNTDFISVYGLTGYFEGWFSNDEASIPVLAKMKVLIGNITLELKSWKREGWNPPKYRN